MDFEPIETQEQFDAAIKSRLARERAEEVERLRVKVSEETGVPAALIAGDDEEAMTAFAKGVSDFARPSAPVVSSSGAFAQKASERSEMGEFVSKLLGDSE